MCIRDRDYIDPMFHEQVLKIPSKNLDTFFSDASQIQALYEMELPGHDIAVLEGCLLYTSRCV